MLLLDIWVTNYEKFHQNSMPVQIMKSQFIKKKDGTIDIKFSKEKEEISSPIFRTIFMIQPHAADRPVEDGD